MLLGLTVYAPTAHEDTSHYDLDLLYHDRKALRAWRGLVGQLEPTDFTRHLPCARNRSDA
jgi:hypothetical protein